MQTFLPYSNFVEIASALDSRRLNKQILESYQILNVLSNNSPTGGWRNHPAVLMWKNAERSLYNYTMNMVSEANSRGIKTDKNLHNLMTIEEKFGFAWGKNIPHWFKDNNTMNRITTTHKANLYKKDPEYYIEFRDSIDDPNNIPCCPTCSYYWVTHEGRYV